MAHSTDLFTDQEITMASAVPKLIPDFTNSPRYFMRNLRLLATPTHWPASDGVNNTWQYTLNGPFEDDAEVVRWGLLFSVAGRRGFGTPWPTGRPSSSTI